MHTTLRYHGPRIAAALAGLGLALPAVFLVLMALGAACAVDGLHGLAHGRELTGMASGAGFISTSALLMAAGALPGMRLRRVAGAAIGAAGLVLLTGAV